MTRDLLRTLMLAGHLGSRWQALGSSLNGPCSFHHWFCSCVPFRIQLSGLVPTLDILLLALNSGKKHLIVSPITTTHNRRRGHCLKAHQSAVAGRRKKWMLGRQQALTGFVCHTSDLGKATDCVSF